MNSLYEWHYLTRGEVTHARQRRDSGLDMYARCGMGPAWGDPIGWLGTGRQSEYERAATLPRCKKCARWTGEKS